MKSLGKCIGNVVVHKILLRHTNIPESKKHLRDEVRDYGEDAFDKAKEYSWSDEERKEIRNGAIKRFHNQIQGYPDIIYKEEEVIGLIDETMSRMLI